MSTPPLTRAERRHLQQTLNDAAIAVDNGHLAWEDGSFDSFHADRVMQAQHKLAQELARFEDQKWMLCDGTLGMMRCYEQMASDLLEGMEGLNGERREDRHRLHTGEYAVSRQLLLNERLYQEARVCTNPAVAAVYLDQWEQEVRKSALTGTPA